MWYLKNCQNQTSCLSLVMVEWQTIYCCLLCPSAGKDLYIGTAVQKAYLEVTEEGSEGAVGSGRLWRKRRQKGLHVLSPADWTHLLFLSGLIALTRTLVLYPQVMADHPFFFVIRERRTGVCHVMYVCDPVYQDFLTVFAGFFAGSILFMGRVTTPDVIDATGHDFDSL